MSKSQIVFHYNSENVYFSVLRLCRSIENTFPELKNKLVFSNEYGELTRFIFGLNDEELIKRICVDADLIDYKLMLEMDLIEEGDIPPNRR